jgi:hypothetical protein
MFKTALLVALASATTLVAGEVSGKWVGTIKSGNSAGNTTDRVYLELQRNGDAISGTVTYQDETKRTEKPELTGDQLTFEIHDNPNGVIKFRLTVGENSIKGEATSEYRVIKLVMTQSN